MNTIEYEYIGVGFDNNAPSFVFVKIHSTDKVVKIRSKLYNNIFMKLYHIIEADNVFGFVIVDENNNRIKYYSEDIY